MFIVEGLSTLIDKSHAYFCFQIVTNANHLAIVKNNFYSLQKWIQLEKSLHYSLVIIQILLAPIFGICRYLLCFINFFKTKYILKKY